MHSKLNNEVPENVWTGNKPSVKHLKIYGCLAYAHLPKENRRKLEPRTRECIFIGYSNQTKGYRLWDPVIEDVIQSKHVKFIENVYGYEHIYQSEIYRLPNITNEYSKVNTEKEETTPYESCTEIGENEEPETNIPIASNEIDDKVDEGRKRYNLRSNKDENVGIIKDPPIKSGVVRNPWGSLGENRKI